ncbi:MAG: hypothetical protein ACLGIF_09060, partial [Actinomycetes bacterium]
GSFTLDQVEVVCADEGLPAADVAPVLVRLVEQSLVSSARLRFGLLETVRAFAAERLSEDARTPLRARHAADTADRVSRLSQQLAGPQEPGAVAAIATLGPDLHAAWSYAVQHDRPLAVGLAASIHGYAYTRQRRDLLEWGLTVSQWDIDHPRMPHALAVAAAAAWADGDLAEAATLATRGVAAAGGPDSPAAAVPLMQSANLAMFAGRTGEAADLLRRVVDLHRAAGQEATAVVEEVSVWQVRIYGGEAAETAAALPELLHRLRARGNPSGLAWGHYVHGEAEATLGHVADALAAYRAADAEGSRSDNRLFVTLARSSSVALMAQHGDPAEAAAEFQRVMTQWEDLGNQAAQWWVLGTLVALLARTGRAEAAARLAGAVVTARHRYFQIPHIDAMLEQATAAARAELGPAAYDAAYTQGAKLSFPAAVAYARELVSRLPSAA